MKQRALTRGRIPGSGAAESRESSATRKWAQAETDQLEALLEGDRKERGPLQTLGKQPGVRESPGMSRRDPLHPQCCAVFAADSSLRARDDLVSVAPTTLGRNVLLLLSLINLQGSSCLLSSPSWAVFMLHPITLAVFLPDCCSSDKALPSVSQEGCDVGNKMETEAPLPLQTCRGASRL